MDSLEASKNNLIPHYQDGWAMWIGVPLITVFIQYLTYEQITLNGMLLYELSSDALKIYLVWRTIRWVIVALDNRFPWQRSFPGRLLLQIGSTWLLGSIVLTALVFLDYWLVRPYPNQRYFSYDLVLAGIFILLVNAIYVGLYFYHLSLQEQSQPIDTMARSPDTFLVRLGKRDVLLTQPDILCLFAEDKLTYLLTHQGRVFPLESSLDKVSAQLAEAQFFRINRKYIISSSLIDQVQTTSSGKLLVQLKPHPSLPETLFVSRARASDFRQWLRSHHSSVK
ncbi:hypothetical protein GCM10028805_37300 [Spirosoma harenae]